MNKLLALILLITIIQGCDKDKEEEPDCNMQEVNEKNANKVTIKNGVWGTIAFTEGNCMPVVDPAVCKTCPVKRTVQIYEFTRQHQADPAIITRFYNSFSTRLVSEVITDNDGFFQTELPAGDYTIVIVENGKLYANNFDGGGGISPFKQGSGASKVNL